MPQLKNYSSTNRHITKIYKNNYLNGLIILSSAIFLYSVYRGLKYLHSDEEEIICEKVKEFHLINLLSIES